MTGGAAYVTAGGASDIIGGAAYVTAGGASDITGGAAYVIAGGACEYVTAACGCPYDTIGCAVICIVADCCMKFTGAVPHAIGGAPAQPTPGIVIGGAAPGGAPP